MLFSLDETAYDDAAYLVDRTFERPYQFTGNVARAKSRDARFFAVRPVMERDSEYNRLNSSHYDSDGSQLSFRRDGNNPSDEHSSFEYSRLKAANSLHQLSSHDSMKSVSPQKVPNHRRHISEA